MLDILIQNGRVVDGSGAPAYPADVAVQDGRIVGLGRFPEAQVHRVIDASGCVVTPGFVDMHSHADFTLPICPTADSLVRQGITTVVTGQCGISTTPLFDENRQEVIPAIDILKISTPWELWSSFGSYLAYLERIGTSINVAPLLGHGTVRAGVMGLGAGRPSAEQMRKMQAEVVTAMESGARGVSTGLIYPPGSFANTQELIAFTRPAAERGGIYFSHIRGEGATLLEAVAEAIQIGREAGAAVQISHFKADGRDHWPKAAQALALIDRARAQGLEVSADMYPYLAGSTSLLSLLPQWAQEGNQEAILQRLDDPGARQQIVADLTTSDHLRITDWEAVVISNSASRRDYEGRDVADLSAEAGQAPHDWVLDALLETELDLMMIQFGMSEENCRMALRHPAVMIGTDAVGLSTEGPLSQGRPHPRNYGAYPRVLGYYVRQEAVITLEEAIHKMSGLPAAKLGLGDRGLVQAGYRADLVVLNPDTVRDRASYQSPHQYPEGIPHVIVNGELVVCEEKHQGNRPGKVI